MPPKPLPLWKNGYFTLPSLFNKKDYFFIIYLFIFENFQLWIYGVLGCFDWWVFVNLDFCLWVFCFWFDELCDIRYLIDGFIYFLIFLWDLGCGLFGWLGNVWLGFRILLFGREKSYNSLVQYRFIVLFDGFFFSPVLYAWLLRYIKISNLNLGFLVVWSYEKLEFQVNCDKDKQLWLLGYVYSPPNFISIGFCLLFNTRAWARTLV